MVLRFVAYLALIGAVLTTSALATAPQSASAVNAQITKMDWQKGTVHLGSSHATLAQPPSLRIIRGADARKFDELMNGVTNDTVEAVSADRKSGDIVVFEYTDSGYVKADDWTSLDPNQMLEDIKNNTENANKERQAQGIPVVHVAGWLEKPQYDKATGTVRWSIAANAQGGRSFNAVALILGRHGYQKLTWVGQLNEYKPRGGLLDKVVSADRFDKGARYTEYVTGDKIAEFGLAALAGAGLAKVGFFAGLLLLFKKLAIVIIVAVAAGYRWIRQRFSGVAASQRIVP
jgi:uncharacterized membrane-anchored protein